MPPPGGFPDVTIKRGVPAARGLTGSMIWGGIVGVTVVGFYLIGQGNIERREIKKERRLARAALIPLLQAEEDVRYVMAKRAAERGKRSPVLQIGSLAITVQSQRMFNSGLPPVVHFHSLIWMFYSTAEDSVRSLPSSQLRNLRADKPATVATRPLKFRAIDSGG